MAGASWNALAASRGQAMLVLGTCHPASLVLTLVQLVVAATVSAVVFVSSAHGVQGLTPLGLLYGTQVLDIEPI